MTITLYDIPCIRDDKNWSPSVWKVRYALNYKKLAHTTVWTEYPDIAALSIRLGVAAQGTNPDGTPFYALPIIEDSSTGKAVAESHAIAQYLDATYPDTPRVVPAGTRVLQTAYIAQIESALLPGMGPVLIPAVHAHLNPPSAAFYRASKEAQFGVPIEGFTADGRGAVCWKKFEAALGTLDGWLGEDRWVMGETLSFVDMALAGWFTAIRRVVGEESEEWKALQGWHGGRWAKFYQSFNEYEIIH